MSKLVRRADKGLIKSEIEQLHPKTNGDADRLKLKPQEQLNAERYGQDTEERKVLSRWVRRVVSWWLGAVIILLPLGGLFHVISDTVACVLLGTTTVNILGLAYIVLQGIFPESRMNRKKPNNEIMQDLQKDIQDLPAQKRAKGKFKC